MWPDRRLIELFGIEHPLVQAPMAGAMDGALAAEVSWAGGLGSLPCAMLAPEQIRAEVEKIRRRTQKPFNLNFFCHVPPTLNNAREAAWRDRLAPYYREYGLDPAAPVPASLRMPFDPALCALLEELRPRVASFHFGLPAPELVARVKRAGCAVVSSATTVAEARWLEDRGADAIVAQGIEAGGHRGMFLSEALAGQVGTFALVPQLADAVKVPVIAAGAIADA
ncbi:MAG: nitronate monooxygenase, partial [Pseudomonadota bacterium]